MVVFDPNVSVSGAGPQGVPGDSAFVYIRYAADNIGTGIASTPDASRPYIAILTTDTEIVTPVASDFTGLWFLYKGATGAPGTNATGKVGASDPTVNDDSAHGFSAGSWAVNTTTHKFFECESAAVGAAVWHQTWPALAADIPGVSDAVSQKHVQGTDQGLDNGGANAVTVTQLKAVIASAKIAVDVSIATAGAPHVIVCGTQIIDTHNAYDPATGVFTVPVAGYYEIVTFFRAKSAAFTAGNELSIGIYVNGAEVGKTSAIVIQANNTSGQMLGGTFITAWLTVGTTVQPTCYTSVNVVLDGTNFTEFNKWTITKVPGA